MLIPKLLGTTLLHFITPTAEGLQSVTWAHLSRISAEAAVTPSTNIAEGFLVKIKFKLSKL